MLSRLAALSLALVAVSSTDVAAQPVGCTLARVVGNEISLWRAGAWWAASPGPLTPGDAMIRTGPDTQAELRCADGLALTVGVGTEASIESLVASARPSRNVVIWVFEGLVGLVSPTPRAGRTEIRAPLAIAAARSTEWLVSVAQDDATAVFARAGVVAVTPSAAAAGAPEALLRPGEGIDVTAAGGAGPVTNWGAARVARTGAALGFGWR
jgi:hypothetical protein